MEDQRFPISVRLIGVMHKEKSKVYMTSVLWSDQNEIVVYRSFQDFKKMHKRMKKAFRPLSKLKKSDRIIPTFRDNTPRKRGQGKGPQKSLLCLKFLQKYCDELLSCDPRVCQSAELIQFFHPSGQDLQPGFSQNGILIIPTDEEMRNAAGHKNSGNVTHPFVTETFRCLATYETKDTKNKPFKVAVNETVDVLIKDKAGWWLVENEYKQMAWFPAPYLEKLDEDDGNDDDMDGAFERGMRYTAVKCYKATKDDEITVTIGSVVEVLQRSNNGWWLVRYNGKAGYIPSMYLQPYNHPHIRVTALLPDAGISSSLQQAQQLSRSQGNLVQPPPTRSPSPSRLQIDIKQRSRSLNVLPEQPPAQPPASTSATDSATNPSSAKHAPPPTIMVEMDGEEKQCRSRLAAGCEGSVESDSSDYSLSDDMSCSSASSCFNLSHSDEQLRLSLTPHPTASNRLSLTSCSVKKILPSVSDPNLYKGPTAPKVPPRPQTQEILTRCSTVTRKKAGSGNLSPTAAEIISR